MYPGRPFRLSANKTGEGLGRGEHPWFWIWYQSPLHTMDGGIQKVCPLTSFPNLTMTTTVALANDYGVNLPIIASSSQQGPSAQGGQKHAQWLCSENGIPAEIHCAESCSS